MRLLPQGIGPAFAKLKVFLRAARPRSFEHILALVATALGLFTPSNVAITCELRLPRFYVDMKTALKLQLAKPPRSTAASTGGCEPAHPS